jgi:hypothetical protein
LPPPFTDSRAATACNDKFKQFLDESTIFTGLSKTIQNEIIQSINNVITITVEDEVKSAPCFAWHT